MSLRDEIKRDPVGFVVMVIGCSVFAVIGADAFVYLIKHW